MTKTATITTRLDEGTLALVDRIAASHGRSRSWFAAEAIRRAAETEAEFMAFVQAGIVSADRGELTRQDRVFADLRDRRRQRIVQ